jgi:hypothetical protein
LTQLEARLVEAVRAQGFEALEERLRAACLPAVVLADAGPDELTRLGQSRLGGCPDFPLGAEWPEEGGRLYTFLLQVDLGSMPRFGDGPLPAAGRLYLFLGEQEAGKGLLHRVFYRARGQERLRMVTVPEGTEFLVPELGLLAPRRLGAGLVPSLPAPLSPAAIRLDLQDAGPAVLERYQALLASLGVDSPARLLGHADSLGEDLAANAFFHRQGMVNPGTLSRAEVERALADWRARGQGSMVRYLKRQLDSIDWHDAHRREATEGARNWQCLLRIRSWPTSGLRLWGDGELHVLVRRDDLAARRFDRTYAELLAT